MDGVREVWHQKEAIAKETDGVTEEMKIFRIKRCREILKKVYIT